MNFKSLVSHHLLMFSLGVVFLSHSSADAFQQVQLTIEGELIIEPFISNPPPGTGLEAVFGLQNGDPFNFTLRFDPAIQNEGLSSFIEVDSVEVQLGSLDFVDTPNTPENTLIFLGTPSVLLQGVFLEDSAQNGIVLSPVTALPAFFFFDAANIGANPNLFPTNLSTADVTNFSSGVFGLFDQNGGGSSDLSINFTELSVTQVPEPSSGIVLTLAALLMGRRRRGH